MVDKDWWSIYYIIISVVEHCFSKNRTLRHLIYAQKVSLGYLWINYRKCMRSNSVSCIRHAASNTEDGLPVLITRNKGRTIWLLKGRGISDLWSARHFLKPVWQDIFSLSMLCRIFFCFVAFSFFLTAV